MTQLVANNGKINAMSVSAIAKVNALIEVVKDMPQELIHTHHVIHGGMYARTVLIKAGCVAAGSLMKVPTILVINGDVTVFGDGDSFRLTGFHVLPASAHRKQAVFANEDTAVTMLFTTKVKTIAEAEDEFTDEADQLMSRKAEAENFINITGE